MIPQFDTCLVCEGVRQEILGKLTIVGFYGASPNVEVGLQRLDQPAVLTFLVLGGPGEGTFSASFDVFDESEQRIVAAVAPGGLTATPNSRTMAIVSLVLTFGHAGTFVLRCSLNDTLLYSASFRVAPMAGVLSQERVP